MYARGSWSGRRPVFRIVIAVLALAAVVVSPIGADAKRRRDKDVPIRATAHVAPTVIAGNPACPAGFEELKVEPPVDGTFTDGALSVTLDFTPDGSSPTSLDWTSTIGVDIVLVKGGPNANAYFYNPEATSDTGLTAPINPENSKPFAISHVTFCYDLPTTEGPPRDETCSDNIDNDEDGLVDQADPDCQEPEGPPGDETCSDGVDNDGDGLIDGDDPDCVQPPQCSDGVDNDDPEDTLVDAADPGCHTDGDPGNPGSYDPEDNDETDGAPPECSDGVDNDDAEDTLADAADPGCHTDGDPNNSASYDPNDTSEINAPEGPPGDPSCSDGIDNDGDGLIDQLDPGCQSPEGPPGDASCSDGIDNDGDGLTDGADPDCQFPGGTIPPGPGGPGGPPAPPGGGTPPGGTPGEADPCANPTIVGTPLNDKIRGTKGVDVIDGLGGNDKIRGKRANDIICGGDGNDFIRGGRGADLIFGEAGDDKLKGGRGREVLDGGSGTDRCRAGKGKGTETRSCENTR